MRWWLRFLLLAAAVAVVPRERPCESDQYELLGLCCDLCPAGSYVSRVCDVDRVTECSPCEPGYYTAHRNQETACLPCSECRDDQELVSDCAQTSNRRCQCKTGSFYCDSEDCVETCFRCSRCDGPTLETCSATRDTICANEGNPGDPPRSSADSSLVWAVVVLVVILALAIILIVAVTCYRRQGVQLPHLVVRWLKNESRDSGDPSQGDTPPRMIPPPRDAECDPAAAGVDSAPLLEQEGTAVAPSEDPEADVQLQAVVPAGGGSTPEQALQTRAPTAPTALEQTGAAAPFHTLEQQYEQKYVLKDGSPEAMNRIYFEFGQEVPKSSWRMFMRFAGLEENDIVMCEHENPGNLAEQQHRMLLLWQSKLGRAASPSRLMAALRTLRLRECLENVINKLVAEGRRSPCEFVSSRPQRADTGGRVHIRWSCVTQQLTPSPRHCDVPCLPSECPTRVTLISQSMTNQRPFSAVTRLAGDSYCHMPV